MYRLFYNHSALKDVLVILINPEANAASHKTYGDVVCIYDENNSLIGINILHIGEVMKIKANGVMFVPDERLIGVVNHILTKEGLEPLPPVTDSGYRVAKVIEVKNHPTSKESLTLKLECGDKAYETTSTLKGIEVGSIIVIALDGTILHDGSVYHKATIKNVKNDVKVMNAPELHIEGKEDEVFLLNEEPSFVPGEDFFLR